MIDLTLSLYVAEKNILLVSFFMSVNKEHIAVKTRHKKLLYSPDKLRKRLTNLSYMETSSVYVEKEG